ncbi:MAG: phage major capsid protein [Bacillus sp. (in: Bacteria)]|nr:phage major capsid protein [Bacillus sp. (in: firmicutes)]
MKGYLEKRKATLEARLEEIRKCEEENKKRVDEIDKENDEGKTEEELKKLRDELDVLAAKKKELEAEKKENEAELKEIEAELKVLDEELNQNNKERAKFLVFEQRDGGQPKMNEKESELRTKIAEDLVKTGKLTIEKPQLRAVTIASGTLGIPVNVHGIENPEEVPYSTIFDFVKVVDMTGAGYNKVSLLTEWSEADEYNEGAAIDEDDPSFGLVTIQPEKGFKTYATISNETLKTSPLNYYGKVEESANVAIRKLVAQKIIAKAVGAKMDDNTTALNRLYNLAAIDENTLLNVSLELGGDEGVYGPSTLVLNKKDLRALAQIVSDVTLQHVYKITPDRTNPNIGTIENDGIACRYILTNQLPAYADADPGDTVMLYGDLKSVEVDLFGSYDIKVSEDAEFEKDLLAIRGTAQIGVGVTKLYGLVEVKKPTA